MKVHSPCGDVKDVSQGVQPRNPMRGTVLAKAAPARARRPVIATATLNDDRKGLMRWHSCLRPRSLDTRIGVAFTGYLNSRKLDVRVESYLADINIFFFKSSGACFFAFSQLIPCFHAGDAGCGAWSPPPLCEIPPGCIRTADPPSKGQKSRFERPFSWKLHLNPRSGPMAPARHPQVR
jgi:hypothetical protein